MTAEVCYSKFKYQWERSKGEKNRLAKSLFRSFKKFFMTSFYMSIVAALSQISVPLLMVLMINYMESTGKANYWTVLMVAVLTILVKILSAFFS